jgi:ferrochelatase
MKTAVLLVNLGTPKSSSFFNVIKFLGEFLNDRRVIKIPFILRYLLVYGLIIPFRSLKSTQRYKKLFTDKGSPLLYFGYSLEKKLQLELSNEYIVVFSMRYPKKSLANALKKIYSQHISKIIIIPLFPQYASSTSGSIFERIFKTIERWDYIPTICSVNQFYNHSLFIKAFAEKIKQYNFYEYDHILFSFHGLPLSHIENSYVKHNCSVLECKNKLTPYNNYCYQATTYETARLIAAYLNINKDKYTVCYQSRLSNQWLSPFTENIIKEKAKQGVKKLLIVCPSFVADCLETIVEVQQEYEAIFIKYGGEKLQLVESLNDDDSWIICLKEIIQNFE